MQSNSFERSILSFDIFFLGIDNLIMIDEPTRRKVYEMGQLGGGGVDSQDQGGPAGGDKKKNKKWGVGEMEFEAMMRMMDNAVSFR